MNTNLAAFIVTMLFIVTGSNAVAQSTVNISLNLHYTDPANQALGGKWFLVANTNAANGIASISVYLTNVSSTGIVIGNGGVPGDGYSDPVTATTLAAILNNGEPYVGVFGTAVLLVYAQDTASGPIILDVGRGAGTPGNIAIDPLGDAAWNNSALIAKGTFGAALPSFTSLGPDSTSANVLANSTTTPITNSGVEATVTTLVRALELSGDYNVDGNVDAADYVLWRKNPAGYGGTLTGYTTWRAQFGQNPGRGSSAHSNSNIPEPATPLAFLILSAAGCCSRRGRGVYQCKATAVA
jgi:hypothetical protein